MFEQIEFNTSVSEPIDIDITEEKNRGRVEIRKVEVFDDLYEIDTNEWVGLKILIKVTREVKRSDNTETKEIAYYICSNDKLSAKELNYGNAKKSMFQEGCFRMKQPWDTQGFLRGNYLTKT